MTYYMILLYEMLKTVSTEEKHVYRKIYGERKVSGCLGQEVRKDGRNGVQPKGMGFLWGMVKIF